VKVFFVAISPWFIPHIAMYGFYRTKFLGLVRHSVFFHYLLELDLVYKSMVSLKYHQIVVAFGMGMTWTEVEKFVLPGTGFFWKTLWFLLLCICCIA
jgi:hypothetical protein